MVPSIYMEAIVPVVADSAPSPDLCRHQTHRDMHVDTQNKTNINITTELMKMSARVHFTHTCAHTYVHKHMHIRTHMHTLFFLGEGNLFE